MIRKSQKRDVSRIAEILVMAKRKNYRRIFNDDYGSFVRVNVLDVTDELRRNPDLLASYIVLEDDFVKGLVRVENNELKELYVDPYYEGIGIGSKLLRYALNHFDIDYLWVLEKNCGAIRFYERNGFVMTDEKKKEFSEYNVKMIYSPAG